MKQLCNSEVDAGQIFCCICQRPNPVPGYSGRALGPPGRGFCYAVRPNRGFSRQHLPGQPEPDPLPGRPDFPPPHQTNHLENARPECRLAVEQGAQEVAPELQQLQQRFAALEQQVQPPAQAIAQPTQPEGPTPAELQARIAILGQQVQRLSQAQPPPSEEASPGALFLAPQHQTDTGGNLLLKKYGLRVM